MSHVCHFYRNTFIVASCICLLSAPVFAGDKVQGKRFFQLESEGTHYTTARELCVAEAKVRHDDKFVDNPLDRVVGEKDDGNSVWCNLANSKGVEDDQHYGMEDWECPPNSIRINDACECEEGFDGVNNACKKHGTPRTKEELLATPQNHDPADCGLSKEQYDALNELLGKKFTTVPYLSKAWDDAVAIEPGLKNDVAALTPDPKNNQDKRTFFNKARNNFWDILARKNAVRNKFKEAGIAFPEQAVADARKTFDKAGITLPNNDDGGNRRAALITINGKVQQIDIDHIVGFAEVPSKMVDSSNLQFSPMRENRVVLEAIARKDMFYDPVAYLDAEKKKMEKNSAACQKK